MNIGYSFYSFSQFLGKLLERIKRKLKEIDSSSANEILNIAPNINSIRLVENTNQEKQRCPNLCLFRLAKVKADFKKYCNVNNRSEMISPHLS